MFKIGTTKVSEKSSVYTVNGVKKPRILLEVGKTYTFEIDTPGHPFYITTDATGGHNNLKGSLIDEAVEKGTVKFTPNKEQRGTKLYYQCNFHKTMGNHLDAK